MSQVGPVIMGHPIARACLESGGVVYSFRTSDRTTGETHYRYERTGQKQGDVLITQETDRILPTVDNLREFSPTSGFASASEWREAIRDVHGDVETPGFVYRIVLLESDTDA